VQSNTNKKLFTFLLLCTFFLFSCENKKPDIKNKPTESNAGVVISFDDTSVNEWYQADKMLRKYSWKATFCVSKINTLNASEIRELLELQNEGHEISGHSLQHFDAPKFVAKNGIDAYINQEINPMLTLMHFYSFKTTSFAYPFGFRNSAIDAALLKKFKIIRGTTYGAEDPFFQNCYFNNTKLVFAIGIDTDHPNFSKPYLIKLLDYAKRKHKILLLFGHIPVVNVTANYQTKMETLQLICNYVKQHNMTFYTLSELSDLK
jgi:peptidoglycan/xylan/chitin deacetylase (PgdA/CDA1 family)